MNNWYVLVGAPCSGKTTLINQLKNLGYQTAPEAARFYIEQQLDHGYSLEEITQNAAVLQRNILQLKIYNESSLDQNQQIFFDTGIPCSAAYLKLNGLEQDDYMRQAIAKTNYKKVFLLDYFEYQKDNVRVQNADEQKILHQYLQEIYQKLDIPIINVPILEDKNNAEERLKYIIDNL